MILDRFEFEKLGLNAHSNNNLIVILRIKTNILFILAVGMKLLKTQVVIVRAKLR